MYIKKGTIKCNKNVIKKKSVIQTFKCIVHKCLIRVNIFKYVCKTLCLKVTFYIFISEYSIMTNQYRINVTTFVVPYYELLH